MPDLKLLSVVYLADTISLEITDTVGVCCIRLYGITEKTDYRVHMRSLHRGEC